MMDLDILVLKEEHSLWVTAVASQSSYKNRLLVGGTYSESVSLEVECARLREELKLTVESVSSHHRQGGDRAEKWQRNGEEKSEGKYVDGEVLYDMIKQVPVETIKEVPVEVIKEVEVIKYVDREVIKEVPVEVIKEVPVEVIKEVEVIKYVDREEIKYVDQLQEESWMIEDPYAIAPNKSKHGVLPNILQAGEPEKFRIDPEMLRIDPEMLRIDPEGASHALAISISPSSDVYVQQQTDHSTSFEKARVLLEWERLHSAIIQARSELVRLDSIRCEKLSLLEEIAQASSNAAEIHNCSDNETEQAAMLLGVATEPRPYP